MGTLKRSSPNIDRHGTFSSILIFFSFGDHLICINFEVALSNPETFDVVIVRSYGSLSKVSCWCQRD